jgi:cobalt-zinc-cadmium efflux system outer membrane protein
VVVVGGCARAVPKGAGFDDVRKDVRERTGREVRWNRLGTEDRSAEAAVRDLLAEGLTADRAVQVALLNNRNLQATYEELGVAQAEVVQAGLLRNPVFDTGLKFSATGGGTGVELSVVQDFLDVFLIPLRTRVAESLFAGAKLRVTGEVMDLAGRTRAAFYDQQAAEQTLELRRTVAAATGASYDLATRLRVAGNINELDLAQERALFEQARVDVVGAEAEVLNGRERLNVLMGLWGEATAWVVPNRLPDVPASAEADRADVEREAVRNSVDLAVARNGVEATARALGIRRAFALFPEAEAGATAERESEGGWSAGPSLAVPVPLFDQGQAATAAARSELERARQRYYAMGVGVRSGARAAWNRVFAARTRAAYYREVILPLRREITERTQLQYNAMQVGAFQLLQAKQGEIEAGVAYIDLLRAFWVARTELDQVVSGRLTDLGRDGAAAAGAGGPAAGGRGAGGH